MPSLSSGIRGGVIAAVLALIVVVPASASGSSFHGTWSSIDTDGSTQTLTVSAGAMPSVTYQDSFASFCANSGAPSVRWVAAGQGTITGDTMPVQFRKSGCGVFGKGGYGDEYSYDASTDTLTDSFGIVWHRMS